MISKLRIILLSSVLLLGHSLIQAQVVVSGDFSVGEGQLEIESDLEFEITVTGQVRALVFQDWAGTHDGSNTSANISESNLAWTLFTTPQSTTVSHMLDNNSYWASQSADVQQEDAYIFMGGFNVTDGSTVLIDAQTFNFDTIGGFNANVSGNFSGNVYLADINGNRLSSYATLGAVPEPSTYAALFGVVALGFAAWRRRALRA